jgi:hypothetical protein
MPVSRRSPVPSAETVYTCDSAGVPNFPPIGPNSSVMVKMSRRSSGAHSTALTMRPDTSVRCSLPSGRTTCSPALFPYAISVPSFDHAAAAPMPSGSVRRTPVRTSTSARRRFVGSV